MRVMIVLEATSGGTLRHIAELAPRLQERGLKVSLVCSANRQPPCYPVLASLGCTGIEVHEISMCREIHLLQDCTATVSLRRLIGTVKPDILHLHSSKAGALGRIARASMLGNAPAVVYTPHCYAFLAQPGAWNRTLYRWIERYLLLWTNRVIAVSESEAAIAAGLGARHKVRTIVNGVVLPNDFCMPPSTNCKFRIGWLGRMIWQKNPQAAVKASFVLNRLGVEHQLEMGGDGPSLRAVENIIRELGCEHSVRLHGHVANGEAFYAGLEAFLMTSRVEGLPYSGLDAMAHGIPIVGFDVPGIRDLVKHGANGLLSPVQDTGALAAHLARLAQDPVLRRKLGAEARIRVIAEFPLERQVERLCSLYHSLAAGPHTETAMVPA